MPRWGVIEARELAAILKGEGLTCCVTHTDMEKPRHDRQKVIDEHKLWGCKYTAIGGMPRSDRPKTWRQGIAKYNAVAAKYVGSGLSLGYHNHSHELIKYDGKTAMQMLFDGLTPRDVWIEIDTYWITHGGGDPAAWISKNAAAASRAST